MKVSKYLSGRRLRIGGWPPTYGQTHAAGGPLTTVWGSSGACTGLGGPIAWFGGPEEVSGWRGGSGRGWTGFGCPRWPEVCVGDCQAPPLPGMVEGGQCTPGYNHRTNTIEIQWNEIEIQNKYNRNTLACNRNTKQIQQNTKQMQHKYFQKNIGNYTGGYPGTTVRFFDTINSLYYSSCGPFDK